MEGTAPKRAVKLSADQLELQLFLYFGMQACNFNLWKYPFPGPVLGFDDCCLHSSVGPGSLVINKFKNCRNCYQYVYEP